MADYTRMVDDLAYHYDGIFGRENVQRAVDKARAILEPVSRIPAFLPILTERFAPDQLLVAAQAEHKIVTGTPEILFVCVHNAGRSQMAAGLTLHLSAGMVRSAGSQPTRQIHPLTICCGDACPIFPGKRYEDWPVADPAGQPIESLRAICDDIQARVTTLLGDILHQS